MAETICAIATAPGGAIGIIRVSGDNAIPILNQVFRGRKPLTGVKGYTVHYGCIIHPETEEKIDEILVTVFRSPHSYTGEDSVEISCHGSRYIMQQVLQVLIEHGARQALPGEYTQRAFMNGKLDLSQAEAVADLIASTNKASHKIALSQLRGNFSSELSLLRSHLLHITSLLELELDFSDHEDVEFASRDELLSLAQTIERKISRLAKSFETGRAIKQGIAVAIVGKTNVGKSTLLNCLLGEDRAIVSNIHGTTRDVIEDTIDIQGIPFRFIDTAGMRITTDAIEQMGIERTYQKIKEATIVIWLLDNRPSPSEFAEISDQTQDKHLIVVYNKSDLHSFSTSQESPAASSYDTNFSTAIELSPHFSVPTLFISAKYGHGIEKLKDVIYHTADIPEIHENDVIITNARHYDALIRAHTAIIRIIDGLTHLLSSDLLSEDLRDCINILGEIIGGGVSSAEILNNIFSKFCIGK
jgi:tRNA modification GTPase